MVAPLERFSGKDQVSTSVNGPGSAFTGNRICSGVESRCAMWYTRWRRSSTKVQSPEGRTTIHTEYLPLGTAWPSIFTFLLSLRVVAELGPGVQTSCHFTSPPNRSCRPRARGREYSMLILVPSITWDTLPSSLARTWPERAGGARRQRRRNGSAPARIDGLPDLIEGFPFLVEPRCHPSFALADRAMTGHALVLVAGKQGVESFQIGAAAFTPDAVDHFRDGPDRVEHRDDLGRIGELLGGENLGRGDAGPRGGVAAARKPPAHGQEGTGARDHRADGPQHLHDEPAAIGHAHKIPTPAS